FVVTSGPDLDTQRTFARVEGAAPEAVTSVRRSLRAKIDARLGNAAIVIAFRQLAGQAISVLAATVIPRTRVSVEEAVLPFRVLVVPGDSRGEAALVVIGRTRTLFVEAIDLSIAIIVNAVAALTSAATQVRRVEPAVGACPVGATGGAILRGAHRGPAASARIGGRAIAISGRCAPRTGCRSATSP